MIAEGDSVMVCWSSDSRPMGEAFGIPPTGKPVTNSGINVFRIAD
ncbi:MAG: ester cyclase [Caldilineaceae bacterium]|nr:ester cyclase [Caldilineaceae bacterium]